MLRCIIAIALFGWAWAMPELSNAGSKAGSNAGGFNPFNNMYGKLLENALDKSKTQESQKDDVLNSTKSYPTASQEGSQPIGATSRLQQDPLNVTEDTQDGVDPVAIAVYAAALQEACNTCNCQVPATVPTTAETYTNFLKSQNCSPSDPPTYSAKDLVPKIAYIAILECRVRLGVLVVEYYVENFPPNQVHNEEQLSTYVEKMNEKVNKVVATKCTGLIYNEPFYRSLLQSVLTRGNPKHHLKQLTVFDLDYDNITQSWTKDWPNPVSYKNLERFCDIMTEKSILDDKNRCRGYLQDEGFKSVVWGMSLGSRVWMDILMMRFALDTDGTNQTRRNSNNPQEVSKNLRTATNSEIPDQSNKNTVRQPRNKHVAIPDSAVTPSSPEPPQK